MTALYTILAIAVVYALIRAKHDSYISHGKWKRFAFYEGILVAIISVFPFARTHDLWLLPILGIIFAFSFWLIFDCTSGYLRTKNILHLGEKGFDARMRRIFLYNAPIWKWKNTGSVRLILFKVIWLVILIGGYISLINTY